MFVFRDVAPPSLIVSHRDPGWGPKGEEWRRWSFSKRLGTWRISLFRETWELADRLLLSCREPWTIFVQRKGSFSDKRKLIRSLVFIGIRNERIRLCRVACGLNLKLGEAQATIWSVLSLSYLNPHSCIVTPWAQRSCNLTMTFRHAFLIQNR